MLSPKSLVESLAAAGVDFYTGVPDSLLKDLLAYVEEHVPRERHITAANEGNAIGIAAGYHLATGKVPCVYMQNSGFGNAINPLTSLADKEVYAIPTLLIIGWRGEPGFAVRERYAQFFGGDSHIRSRGLCEPTSRSTTHSSPRR